MIEETHKTIRIQMCHRIRVVKMVNSIGLEKYQKSNLNKISVSNNSNNKLSSTANKIRFREKISKLQEMDKISINQAHKLRIQLVLQLLQLVQLVLQLM